MRRRDEGGTAVVDFVLVSVLVVVLFLLVVQVAVVLHVRNVLVASAAEGARWAANADVDTGQAELRAREAVAGALSDETADAMTYRAVLVPGPGGAQVVEVEVRGPLPLVLLPSGPLTIRVQGHALEESR